MMAAVAMIMTGCSSASDVEESARDSNKLTFHVNNVTNAATRAGLEADGHAMTDLWVFDYMDGQLAQQVHQAGTDTNFGEVTMYMKSGRHAVYFVASRGDSPALDASGHKIVWKKPSDTFWQRADVDVDKSKGTMSVTLGRVATRLRVSVDDHLPAGAQTMTVSAERWWHGLDYLDGSATDNEQHDYEVDVSDGVTTASFYSISPEEWKSVVTVGVKIRDTDKTEAAQAEAEFYRNRTTTIHGNLFGSQRGATITLDDKWGEETSAEW